MRYLKSVAIFYSYGELSVNWWDTRGRLTLGVFCRLNKKPPNLGFKRKDKGGISFTSTSANTHLDLETVKAICGEYKIHNADISLRYDATADDLIDVIEGNRVYMPCVYVVNKIDQITVEELEVLDRLPHYCPVRCEKRFHPRGLGSMRLYSFCLVIDGESFSVVKLRCCLY
jgi:ribosome-interacting GTPase 1